MSTMTYKCPCCGAPLAFSGASGKLACASCGNEYDPDAIEALTGDSGSNIQFDRPEDGYSAGDAASMQAYTCEACGAELVTDGTTTATECPYCGSPTILPERISSGVRPEVVVPFKITKEQAQQQFEGYFQGKKLMPNVFLNSRNRVADMRKLYVPYWLFNCDARADMAFDAEREQVQRQGDWEITRTEHWLIRRAGGMSFKDIPVDGSEKMDDKISESLEPYDMREAVPFQPAVLAGAMADNADVNAEACESRAVERVERSVENTIRSTVKGYDRVSVRRSSIQSENGRVKPALMPVWLITTEKQEQGGKKTYTFAINGQTGELTCDVPYDRGKAAKWFLLFFAIITAAGLGLLALLDSLNMWFAPLLLAAVVAFAVVGSMQAKLKTAVRQSAAGNYLQRDSFHLEINEDRYLYTTTSKRRIQTQSGPKK